MRLQVLDGELARVARHTETFVRELASITGLLHRLDSEVDRRQAGSWVQSRGGHLEDGEEIGCAGRTKLEPSTGPDP